MNDARNTETQNGLIGILYILWKRKTLVILGTGAATVLAVIIVLLLPKVYQSTAVVSLGTIKETKQNQLQSNN